MAENKNGPPLDDPPTKKMPGSMQPRKKRCRKVMETGIRSTSVATIQVLNLSLGLVTISCHL